MIISSLRFKNNFVICNYKLKIMKHFITSIVLLFITVSISAQTKEETKAQNRTDEIVELLSLNKDETLKVYEALLAKEKKITILKEEYKDNDNDELNPRKCFTGYGLELVEKLPMRSKKWLVTIHTPGTKLITHQDSTDKIRVHIPIHTNEDSNWIIGGEEFHMEPGWAYLVNTTIPHSVENKGSTNRIHLYGKVWTNDI